MPCAPTAPSSMPISGWPMTDLLRGVFVAPFAEMAGNPTFLTEVLFGGIAAGLMYSLVALGFVLIFKASGVFNFAQGVMVLFSALTLVGLMEKGVPVPLALGLTLLTMVALAFAIERIVLRPLVNQPQIILFIGGNLTGASPGGVISSFVGESRGGQRTSAGSMAGQAACVPRIPGSVAECAWADNDTFGVVASPTLSVSALAAELRDVRPQVEHLAK